jgi:hypothetical protein
MRRNIRARGIAVAALTLTAVACDPGTGPEISAELDADAAVEGLGAMRAAIGSDDLSGFRALAGRTPFGASQAVIGPVVAMTTADADTGGRAFALDLARRMGVAASAAPSAPASGPIISGWHRGSTFVYDPEVDEYRPDLTREGAPATGVRFVLYEVDVHGNPIPGQEVGYADLVDEGDGTVEDIVLRLQVVRASETLLDYRATLDHDATSAALAVDGFLIGDGTLLEFDISVAAEGLEGAAQLDLDFELGVPEHDLTVVGHVRGVEEDEEGQGDVELDIRSGTDHIGVEMTGAGGVLDGTVLVNGAPFALVQGPAGDPLITDPSGDALTLTEIALLHGIVKVVEDVFELVEDLVEPVGAIVLLGFIL